MLGAECERRPRGSYSATSRWKFVMMFNTILLLQILNGLPHAHPSLPRRMLNKFGRRYHLGFLRCGGLMPNHYAHSERTPAMHWLTPRISGEPTKW